MQIITDKKRFAAAIFSYIKHKKILADKSTCSYYRNSTYLNSISQCHSLALMAKKDCREFSFSGLCKLVVVYEKHLRNILPTINNTSYKSQLEILENIVLTAKTYKNGLSNIERLPAK